MAVKAPLLAGRVALRLVAAAALLLCVACATASKTPEAALQARLEHLQRMYAERTPALLLEIAAPDWRLDWESGISAEKYIARAEREWRQVRAVQQVRFQLPSWTQRGDRAETEVRWDVRWLDEHGAPREEAWRQTHEWVRTDRGWLLVRTSNTGVQTARLRSVWN